MISITEKEFAQLSNYIKENYGLISGKKKNVGNWKAP